MTPLLSSAEVARLLDVSERIVLERARSYANGNPLGLRGLKLGRKWMFRESDVMKFLDANMSAEPLAIPRRKPNWRTA